MILPLRPSWRAAGYDGVEVTGSKGYLINDFAACHHQRDDQWGGDYARRMRFAVEVVKAVRQRAPATFIIIYRLSMLDLVNDGSTLAEVTELAKAIEAAGATIIIIRDWLARSAHSDHRHAGTARSFSSKLPAS